MGRDRKEKALKIFPKKVDQNSILLRSFEPTVERLCEVFPYGISNPRDEDVAMPSVETLREAVEILRSILFPGYFGNSHLNPFSLRYRLGAALDEVYRLLTEQVMRGFCFECAGSMTCQECEERAKALTAAFIEELPRIRSLLATDVEAAYLGDPAARSHGEVIFCYPSLRALTNYRIAHSLHRLGVPLIPRIITEMAHSDTGIDIHPGAEIGDHFFMDHGTGIVIGETTIIGSRVRIYQGVTLGAKSFPLDEGGNPIKGIPRHPIVEDDVIIYAGATILGRVRIGKGSIIGGNVWVTEDVPPGSRVLQGGLRRETFAFGEGI